MGYNCPTAPNISAFSEAKHSDSCDSTSETLGGEPSTFYSSDGNMNPGR